MLTITKIPRRHRLISLMLLAAFLGGATGVFIKKAVLQVPPIPLAFLRFVFAGLVLLPVVFSGRVRLAKFKKAIPVSLLLSANITLFTFGIQRTSASVSQMLYTCLTIIAAIFSYFILKERLGSRKIAGIVIGFAGSLIIILLPVFEKQTALHGDLIGNLIILAAVFSASLYTVLSKRLQEHYTPMELTVFFVMTTLIVLALLLPFDLHQHPHWWRGVGLGPILEIAYAGAFGTAIYYLIYQEVIKSATPVVASMILYLQPIFTIFWASILLGERVTGGFLAGSILVFAGVALTNSSSSQKRSQP